MLHEMAHALGMAHTHQRQDRESYVEIWKNNIKNKNLRNFGIENRFETHGVPYDYLSIMHYTNSVRITPKLKLCLNEICGNDS